MDHSGERTPGARFDAFVALIARLRGPGGCPWDREQTHESLKAGVIEEAYEVAEAIDHGPEELASELGDLLLQVVFHARIATEEGRFTVAEVIDRVADKMVRRHPHVFGDVKAETPNAVLRNWEALKEAERAARGVATSSMLDSVSTGLPAVLEAFQVSTKASRVGFDWPTAAAALEKLEEEVGELREALEEQTTSQARAAEEIGDLLFVAVSVARLAGVDPESALKAANRKFRRRFSYVEERLRAQGRKPEQATLGEMDALWDEVKAREKPRDG